MLHLHVTLRLQICSMHTGDIYFQISFLNFKYLIRTAQLRLQGSWTDSHCQRGYCTHTIIFQFQRDLLPQMHGYALQVHMFIERKLTKLPVCDERHHLLQLVCLSSGEFCLSKCMCKVHFVSMRNHPAAFSLIHTWH